MNGRLMLLDVSMCFVVQRLWDQYICPEDTRATTPAEDRFLALSALPCRSSLQTKIIPLLRCEIVLQCRGTLHIHRATSPLAWLVEGEERWETTTTSRMFSHTIVMKPSCSEPWC
ncbi:hypothetical protein TNCV_838571 [Trichonephila clavipes]|nr:hypothetical protein TNCV_838571 [Trichonephila clavipes]